jgi:hypothetical protein
VNVVAVVSRLNFKASALFRLNKTEIPNCIYYLKGVEQADVNGQMSDSPILVVGTTFLNPEEQMPSAGRLLLFEPHSLNLLQEF